MAVVIKTENPEGLLRKFKNLIQDGQIKTWRLDREGDLTSNNLHWSFKAWFTTVIKQEERLLIFGIIASKRWPLTYEIYGVYHGRLISTLLAYFDTEIVELTVNHDYNAKYDTYSEI